ncbi:hypothetical protein [Photobacterium leiognathi]|uniref:hypothetical protein n=1 Tax=Photobacterium leiognathi TaxID=553611 RepID=UPI00298157AD|nr:hypothetical protein [Photobacterium leiognathi]
MDQTECLQNYFIKDIRSRLVEKLNEARRTIISGDKDRVAQVLIELDLYQKTFDSLYDKRNDKHLEKVA